MQNPFSRLFKAREKTITIDGGTTFTGFENYKDSLNLKTYKESLYLFIGVSMITKRAAGIELELYKIANKAGAVDEVFDHQVLDMFYSPNPLQTRREFFETSFAHYLLAGDTFWYIDRTDNAIYALQPDRVEVVLSNDNKRIVAYEYQASTTQRFDPADIVHIKNSDPSDLVRGVGVIRPASSRIISEREASKYQSNFFRNQGRPDMAVFADRPLDAAEGDAARAKWKSIFGNGQGGQTAFFGNDIKSIQELNKTPKEMDLMGSQNFLRDDILAALRIPKAMVTSDDVNLANAKEAYRMYLQEAVIPLMDAFVDAINQKMLPAVDETVFFSFPDPTPNDRENMLKEATQLKKAGIITANEAREMFEYDVVPDGDTLQSAQNRPELAQEAKKVLRHRPMLVKRLTAGELTTKALLSLNAEPERQMNSIFPTKDMKVGFAKAVNDKVDRKATDIKDVIDKFHAGQQERVLESDLQPDGFLDVSAEKSLAVDAIKPALIKLYTEGGQGALDALFAKSADTFFVDEVLLAAVAERAAFFADSVIETTFQVLKGKIVSGLAAGNGPDDIARDIRSYYTDMSVGRAKTIARTETNYVLSKATNDAYNQSSVVTGKEWISAGDANVRPDHVDNNGEIIGKGGTFPSGEEYPGQHSINCRCVLAPTV